MKEELYEPGQVVHKWTVLELVPLENRTKYGRHYKCRCACGAEKIIRGDGLKQGRTKQCKSCTHKGKQLCKYNYTKIWSVTLVKEVTKTSEFIPSLATACLTISSVRQKVVKKEQDSRS